jgi:hypothetical protein
VTPVWDSEAERELRKIPFFVRGKAKRNTERFAAEKKLALIKIETLYDAKAYYSGRSGMNHIVKEQNLVEKLRGRELRHILRGWRGERAGGARPNLQIGGAKVFRRLRQRRHRQEHDVLKPLRCLL